MANITVPQQDGEIVLSRNGDPAVSYAVSKGQVTVDDEDAQWFLGAVNGSSVAQAKPAAQSAAPA